MRLTADLSEIAVSLDGIIEHRALHQERVITLQHSLDSILVGRHEN